MNNDNINFDYAAFDNQQTQLFNKTSNQDSFLQMLDQMTPLQIQQSPSPSNSSYTTVNETPIRVTRPPNAYLLFNKEQRRVLKDQDPTMKVADISKEIGLRWKNMPKEEKDKYIQQANKLKEEKKALYPNAMYMRRSRAELIKAGRSPSTSNTSSGTKRKKTKKEKSANIPKHPLSAYMWYLTEVRPDIMRNFPGSNVGQISKLCADRWNSMTEQQKLPWSTKAQADKLRYAREMQVYAIQHDKALGRGTRQKYRTSAQNSEKDWEFDIPSSIFNNYHV